MGSLERFLSSKSLPVRELWPAPAVRQESVKLETFENYCQARNPGLDAFIWEAACTGSRTKGISELQRLRAGNRIRDSVPCPMG